MKNISLPFTDLEIQDRLILARTHQHERISLDKHRQVMQLAKQEFSDQEFALILDEANSYSVDFSVLREIRNNPKLKCCAIISYRLTTQKMLSGIVPALKKPSKFFRSRNDAIQWAKSQLKTNDN